MTGTIINVIAILAGSLVGILFGARLPERIRHTVVAGLGLFTLVTGVQMFFKTQQSLVVLGALLIGCILGELLGIEDALAGLGARLEKLVQRRPPGVETPGISGRGVETPGISGRGVETPGILRQDDSTKFVRGFLTASLLFCIGPMAILGSIQDGLTGDFELLAIKSVLDAFASMAFASTLGIGVAFSSLIVLIYQGGITLLAGQAQALISEPMMLEMIATGGVLLVGLALSSLLEIKQIRVGNFLPALLIAPLIVAVLAAFGITW